MQQPPLAPSRAVRRQSGPVASVCAHRAPSPQRLALGRNQQARRRDGNRPGMYRYPTPLCCSRSRLRRALRILLVTFGIFGANRFGGLLRRPAATATLLPPVASQEPARRWPKPSRIERGKPPSACCNSRFPKPSISPGFRAPAWWRRATASSSWASPPSSPRRSSTVATATSSPGRHQKLPVVTLP